MSVHYYLCGDIGGTNSRLTLYQVTHEELSKNIKLGKKIVGKHYANENFDSFLSITRNFLETEVPAALGKAVCPYSAVIAVAGPVSDNRATLTNREHWLIDGDELATFFGINAVKLVNDFLAAGYGLLTLDHTKDVEVLQEGKPDLTAPIACIGPGTGLGECFLTLGPDNRYHCYPCEGGHAEFAPRNDEEFALLSFLKERFSSKHRVSVERIVSGTGLVNVYDFLVTRHPELVDDKFHTIYENAGDQKGAIIATNADSYILFQRTIELFAGAYGSEAGVACLKYLPYGGLYLAGGVSVKNLSLLRSADGPFQKALFDKGRVSHMLSPVPIYAVLVDDLGERGAQSLAIHAIQEMTNTSQQKNVAVSSMQCAPVSRCPVTRFGPYVLSAIIGGLVAAFLSRRA